MAPQTFKQKVRHCADMIGVKPKEIHLRSMIRKWGSCSTRGRLTFNREILGEETEIQNEAILHEVLHLKYPNHGKMFHVMYRVYIKRIVSNFNL